MERLRRTLLVSLLIHLLLLLLFNTFPNSIPSLQEDKPSTVWIDLKKGEYKIADIEPPAFEAKPKDTRFLGMYDSRVSQEEVAARQGRGKKAQQPSSKSLSALDKGLFALPQKFPAQKTLEEGTPGEALPEDFYPDFKRGEHTYLNVLRFPEVQYFVRLKRVFKITFDPAAGLQVAYLNNQISRGQVETVLGVSVDAKGNLAEVFIFRGSGIDDYDQETLRTIRASAPFSAPPAKLLDSEGLVRMSWTFTVYL